MWRVLRAVQDWRHVTALVRASVHVYSSWCPVSKGERTRPVFVVPMWSWTIHCIGMAKNLSQLHQEMLKILFLPFLPFFTFFYLFLPFL
jgi:hypothetical protein